MDTLTSQITNCIESTYNMDGKDMSNRIIVYPCGDIGVQTINIMKNIYHIDPAYIIDNEKYKYSSQIRPISFFENIDSEKYIVFLTSTNQNIYYDLKHKVLKIFPKEQIIELSCMKNKTLIGRHSYGPICCDHALIESIGSFCSFAKGVDVMANHEMKYITTHPMIYFGQNGNNEKYEDYKNEPWYVPGVNPKSIVSKIKRITIGNDVWLGRNVTITNYACIGNGVIAGGGAVITKNVPDYAVVAGVPAKIVKYRYNSEQIAALNKISWWDWSDSEIADRFDDFYLPVDDFIRKYEN